MKNNPQDPKIYKTLEEISRIFGGDKLITPKDVDTVLVAIRNVLSVHAKKQ